jgi:hypothetical protein
MWRIYSNPDPHEGILQPSKVVNNKELLMCKSIVRPQNKTVLMSVAIVNERHVKLDRETIVAFDSAFPIEMKSAGTRGTFSDLPEHVKDMIGKCSEKINNKHLSRDHCHLHPAAP